MKAIDTHRKRTHPWEFYSPEQWHRLIIAKAAEEYDDWRDNDDPSEIVLSGVTDQLVYLLTEAPAKWAMSVMLYLMHGTNGEDAVDELLADMIQNLTQTKED